MLKSKISNAVVTDTQLYYRGSITIDEVLMRAADLHEGERVDVLNLNTGARLQTYVIKGASGSQTICLNGPAARSAYKGDKVMIISYGIYTQEELKDFKATYVELDQENNIIHNHRS
jgi:aspartate 1-decarboxylase